MSHMIEQLITKAQHLNSRVWVFFLILVKLLHGSMCHTGLHQQHHPFSKGFLAPFYFSSQFKYCFFLFPHLHQSLPTLSLIFNVSLRISSLFPKAIFFFLLFVVQDHPRLSNIAVKCQSFKIIAPKVCISHKHRNLSWATWVITYETPIKCVHFITTCLLCMHWCLKWQQGN